MSRGVASETWKLDESDVADFVRRDHGNFSIGQVNITLTMTTNAPTHLLSNGSPCPDSSSSSPARAAGPRADAAIRFICDTSVYGAGAPALVVQFPSDDAHGCAFEVEWPTHVSGLWLFTRADGGGASHVLIVRAPEGRAGGL
ncbi:hypothetical protein BV22DRAFT_1035938 [Leucogyrophana mollusca]|uniref:Uncharacterized protein n=1 Tax=Leucogyrophana mollusca TaxID=85980 RepID=A0ACB8BE54_9AGAM|nr:hypothetical protein BV22DRAFT_1035938 [Leucogyrophana mollusca]